MYKEDTFGLRFSSWKTKRKGYTGRILTLGLDSKHQAHPATSWQKRPIAYILPVRFQAS